MSYGGPPMNHSNPNFYPGPPRHSQGPPPFNPNHPHPHFQQQPPYPPGPQQGGYPPQGGFPQSHPPPQQQGGSFPQQQGFPPPGQYPPQGYGAGQFHQQQGFAAPPSPGYDPRAVAQGDATGQADDLRKAMKGMGTDDRKLIAILATPDPLRMALIRNAFQQRFGRSLESDVTKETSSWFREGLLACVRGPLMQDVHNVHKAIKGLGTKESVLNDVLLGRSNADMRAIKQAYQQTHHSTLEQAVEGDLSMKTERLFSMVMAANRSEETTQIIPQEIDRDVVELHRATDGKIGTDQMTVCSILTSRSDGQLRTIAQQFPQKYHITLEKIIEKEFSGHMQDALLLIIGRAADRAMTDAIQLEETMKGLGTKDDLLMNRVARIHWDRAHMDQVERAYAFKYKKPLTERIKSDTRGRQEDLLLAMLA